MADGKIHFRCPNCDRAVSVAIQAAGKRGKCPGCGQSVQVPAPPPPSEPEEEEVYRFQDEAASPESSLGPSLPLQLARRGWKPYKFSNSNVVVFLPETI